MNEKKRLIKNTSLIALGNFGAKIISFLLLPIYTSILDTSEYGTYDFIVAISAFLLPIVTVCMHEAMFRFIIDVKLDKNELKKIITNTFFIVLLGIFCFALILFGIHIVFPKILNLNYIFLFIIANSLYTYSNNLLRGMGKIKEYAIISSFKNILQLILNVISVAILRLGMKGLLLSLCISEFLPFCIIILVSKLWRQIDLKIFSFKELKPMLKYSIPLIPNNLSSQIINISDRLVISAFLGSASNGIYSISYKFPNVIETIYHFFYIAWSESASRYILKGKEEAEKYYNSLYIIINNFIFSIILLMIAGMPILFKIFIKGNYIEGIIYVPILLLAMYFDCIAKFYSGLFTAIKKTKNMAKSTVFASLVNLIINIILIKKIGLYAAAISTLISEIILVIMRKIFIYRDIVIKLSHKNIFIQLAIIILIFILFDYHNYIKIIISISISTIYAIIANKYIIISAFEWISKRLKIKKFIN